MLIGQLYYYRYSPGNARAEVYERDGHRCRYCQRALAFDELTIDHIIPASVFPTGSRWGNRKSNLNTSCKRCNNVKGSAILHGCCFVSTLFLYHPELKVSNRLQIQQDIRRFKTDSAEMAKTLVYRPEAKSTPLRVSIGELCGLNSSLDVAESG